MKKNLKVYLPIAIIAVVLVVSAVFLGITAINKNNTKDTSNCMTLDEIEKLEEKVNELTEEEIAELKEEATNGVQDEITLRLLLLLDDEIEIKVSNSIELIAGMKVNGTKTLTGDACLKMFLGSEKNSVKDAVLMVSRGTTLNMEGLVLDGNGVCHAILVQEGAALNYNDGTVQYGSPYGIHNLGTTYVNGGTITKCMAAGLGTAKSSKTYVVGGNLKDNYKNHIWSAAGSTVEVTGGVFDHSYSHAIHNIGTLTMTGGTIKNSNTADACAVANFGKAYIDGGNDYIEISNCVTGFFSEKDTMEVNKVYGHDIVRNFLRIKEGKGKVTNCKIENTGTYAVRAGGEVTIENIYAEDLGTHGIYISPGKVTVKNVEVKNAKQYGFVNCGGEVVATDIKIMGAGTSAFINYDSTFNGKGERGLLTLKDCTATDCKSNLIVRGGTSVKVSDCVFNKTVRTNVHVTEGNAELKNVKLLGSTDADCSIISIRKDSKATLNNVEMAYGNRGISLAGKVTVIGGSIHDNKGELAGNAVRAENNAVYKLEGVKIYNNHNISQKMAGGVSFMAKGSHGTIINCEITNNSSVRTVGGIYAEEAELNISNTVFKNNETTGADGDGGAILLQKTKSIIKECTFEANKAGTDYQNVGGAIYSKAGSDVTIRACKFTGNVAGRGGAIANVGTLTITEGTTFTGNTCTEGGAGVYNGGNGVVTDTGSIYEKNTLTEVHAGGAIRNDGANTQYILRDAVLTENSSLGDGGAIYSNGLAFIATRCTFKNNTAEQGGAAYINVTSAAKNPTKENGKGFALSATDCIFENNKSTVTKENTLGGGAIFFTGTGKAIMQTDSYDKAYFKGNHAEVEGGAIVVGGNAELTLRGYKFTENTSNLSAAAIYVKGKLTDTNGYYYKNVVSSEDASNAKGGAIQCHLYKSIAQIKFTDTVFEENSTPGDGGAIYNNGTSVALKDCKLVNNMSRQGGAIYNKAKATLVNVVIDEASYKGDAGSCIYVAKDGTLSLDNIKMNNIGTGKDSHAILNNGGTVLTVNDATKSVAINNVAGHGIVNMGDGTTELVGVSIQDVNGSGRYAVYSDSGSVNLKDIAIHNVAKDAVYVKGGTATVEDATIGNIKRAAITATETTDTDNNVTATGEVTLKNVAVKVPEDAEDGARSAQYGIYCVRGKVNVDNVNIANTGSTDDDHAVINNGGIIQTLEGAEKTITVIGSTGNGIANTGKGTIALTGVKVQNVVKKGISSDSGTVTVENVAIKKADDGIYLKHAEVTGTLKVKGATIEDVTRGIAIAKGKVIAENVIVKKATEEGAKVHTYGVYVHSSDSTAELKNVTVEDATTAGVYTEKGIVLADGLLIKRGARAIHSKEGSLGTADNLIKGISIQNATHHSLQSENGAVYVDGINISNGNTKGIVIQSGTATIKNVEIDGTKESSIYVGKASGKGAASVALDGGTIKNCNVQAIEVSGSTVTTTTNVLTVETSKHGIFVQSGTADMKNLVIKRSTNAAVSISGGTLTGKVTVTPTSYSAGTTIVTKGGSVTAETLATVSGIVGITADSNGGEWAVDSAGKLVNAGAKVGDKCYSNLLEAIKGAQENDTITLLENASVSSTISISKSLTITSSKAVEINGNAKDVHLFDVASGKTLKIEGASETARITIKKDATKNVINNNGTTQLKNVVIDGGRLGINNASGTLNVENSIIKNTSNKGVAIAGGNATIKNSTIQNTGASGLFIYSNTKTVELNNVTVQNVKGDKDQHGVTIQKGAVTIKNSLTVQNTPGHGIAVTGGSLTTDSTANGTITVSGCHHPDTSKKDRCGIYASVAINVSITSISDCDRQIGAKNATVTINGKSKKVGNSDTYYSLDEF